MRRRCPSRRHRCKARIGRDFCRSKDDPPAAKPAILLLSLRWTFVAKRASQIILLKSRTDFRDPAEFWQPLVHGADGVFGRHSRRIALGPCPEFALAPWEQVLSE